MPEKFFVRIDDAASIRKEILLSTKGFLEMLKEETELKDIRKKKVELAHEFKQALSSFGAISRKLKAKLPKKALKRPKIPGSKPEKFSLQTPAKQAARETPRKKSKLQLLEEELSAVEQRLKGLE